MVVQLYVWGPAFGLPSIDAECLAAIAYLAQTLGAADYQLIQSSPSAVPTQLLPTLYDSRTSAWISGFTSIVAHLHSHPPPTFQPAPSASKRTAAADGTAYMAFLNAHAAPLLALSLYVSSANYGAATRPAYSALLPLPLPWTEPPAVRAAMTRRAAHLGLSRLDTDVVAAEEEEEKQRRTGSAAAVGRLGRTAAGIVSALTPEQKSRIRLEETAREVLDVLADVDWSVGDGSSSSSSSSSKSKDKDGRRRVMKSQAARCLAFGYLALMLLPEVPRPWLREVMQQRYPGLCAFVRNFKAGVFPRGWEKLLPWAGDGAKTQTQTQAQASVSVSTSAWAVTLRFARAVIAEVPLVGEWWTRRWTARKKREVLMSRGQKPAPSNDLLLVLGAGLGLTALGAGVFFYRGLPPFGEAVQAWRRPAVALSGFGAAGAMFSEAWYGLD